MIYINSILLQNRIAAIKHKQTSGGVCRIELGYNIRDKVIPPNR